MELYALETGVLLQDRYDILSVIGQGGFSILYKAYDRELQAAVAIKEYFPATIAERIPHTKTVLTRQGEGAERFRLGLEPFQKEAQRMAALGGRHNTVHVLGSFAENNTAYIVMELLEGMSLLAYLKTLPNERFTDIEDAKQIVSAVAEALEYAHLQKLLHRDVSPDNIFLCHDGKVKLIDFGAARETTDDGALSVVVKSGCTPPEQYRKHGKQGPWTDLYALGATFYRMLTGVYPEAAPDRADKTDPQEQGCVPPSLLNPAVPAHIDALILRCLAYDPSLRIAHATEIREVLQRETVLPHPCVLQAKRKRIQRLTYGLFAACLLLFVLIGWIVYQRSETLYTLTLDVCSLVMEIPETFSTEKGLETVLADFRSLYPQIEISFVPCGTENADVFLFTGDTSQCFPLDEIQKVEDTAGTYAVTLAYDTTLLYWNVEKAFQMGIQPSAVDEPEYAADSYAELLDSSPEHCAYRGSVSLYRDIQLALPGMYAVYPTEAGLTPVQFSVAADLPEKQAQAAMRFLVYLMGERAQEILFIHHAGLLPANQGQYQHYMEVYSALTFLSDVSTQNTEF